MSLLTQNSNMLKEILFSTLMAATLLQAHAQKMVVGSCTLKDGGIYTGELVSGKPGGKGRVQYSNGDTYEGSFVKGMRHGEGIFTAADGSRYEGNWTKNERNGRGTFYAVNNNRYVGLWFRNQKEGHGIMYYYNGDVYEGSWKDDQRNGKGTKTLSPDWHGEPTQHGQRVAEHKENRGQNY